MDIEEMERLLDPKVDRSVKLDTISKMVKQRIAGIIGKETPNALGYVVTDLTLARYARLGSEGMKATNQDGLSFTFSDDDLAPYMDEILAFKEVEDTVTNERHGAVGFF